MTWYTWKLWLIAWAGGEAAECAAVIDRGAFWRPFCGKLWLRTPARLHACLLWRPTCMALGASWSLTRGGWSLLVMPLPGVVLSVLWFSAAMAEVSEAVGELAEAAGSPPGREGVLP